MLKHRVVWTAVLCQILAVFSVAQAQQKEFITSGIQLGFGSRAVAMGGAYSALGGDYSASFWNPAALRDVQRVEIFGSLGQLNRENNFALQDSTAFFTPFDRTDEENFTKFNDFGVAYPVPTIQGSLVFSFGFNRVKSFDSNFDFQTFNNTADDQVSQAWHELERGSLNAWTFAGAVDVSPNVTFGAGLNFWTGGSDFESTFREVDTENVYFDPDSNFGFNDSTIEDQINSDITGFNLKLGSQFRVTPMLTIGATISTPITYKIEEDWSYRDELGYDDGFIDVLTDEGQSEYKIQSPWTFGAGAALKFLNFVVAGDVEYNDWSQIRYKTAPPVENTSQTEENRLISDNYRATTRVRLGGEFTLPLTGLSFRAGYFLDPAVYQNADPDEDKQFLSAGVGLLVDKQVRLDATYVHGFWKSFNSDIEGTSYVEDIKTNQFFVSLAFRM